MATQLQGFQAFAEKQPRIEECKKRDLRILVVSDQNPAVGILGMVLESAGYSLYPVCTSQQALQNFQFQRPDVILVDLCLPDATGKLVIQRLRQRTIAPILVISVRQDDSETISCLDAGADDYLAKPFAMDELLARLRAALRRAFGVARSEVFSAGDLRIVFDRRQVLVGELEIKLTATEYDLLKVLASHAGLVRTHYQLIQELWGSTQYQDAVHLLRVTISNLRRKLQHDSSIRRHIVTELGVGYRLRPDSDWSAA